MTTEIQYRFTNQELADVNDALTFLGAQKGWSSSVVLVDISVLRRQFKALYEPVQEAINELVEEHGEGEEGAKVVKPNTPGMRRFNKAINDLLKATREEVTFRPLVYEDMLIKHRDEEAGERSDEVVDLTADHLVKLGPVLKFKAESATASKGKAKQRLRAE